MILSTALMFRHLGWEEEAAAVEKAVRQTLTDGCATPDLKGILTTREMGAAIRSRLPHQG
jgi:isocitrate/isopropylmalate dehydrogenase